MGSLVIVDNLKKCGAGKTRWRNAQKEARCQACRLRFGRNPKIDTRCYKFRSDELVDKFSLVKI